jgi:3',5'-cyclic AMP phosphodiesterase CpdA
LEDRLSDWDSAKNFTWLHITDLHVGMQHQNWLWPTLKNQLFDDLAQMTNVTGAIDTVIFSGDVVQKGIADEFDAATAVITELLDCLGKLGSKPSLFVLATKTASTEKLLRIF